MSYFLKIFGAFCVIVAVSSCEHMYNQITKPRPWRMAETPEGTPEFRKGWEDGCETGMGAYGNDTYKMIYTYKQDFTLIDNPEYYRAWKDAYTYCRWYTWNWVRPWMQ